MNATDVVVIGGGVAGLVAARAAAMAGATVSLLEAADHLGGLIGHHDFAGVTVDSGAESFATRGGHVATLATELGLTVVTPSPVPARVLHTHDDQADLYPLPAAGVLGIPTNFDAPGLTEILGTDGLTRARQDLTMGTGHTHQKSLADLVSTRMGAAVLDRLVRPIVRGVHSVEPEELAAAVLLPGIHTALRANGSLAGALLAVRQAAPAGSAVAGIDGGVHRLVTALADDCAARAVTLRTASPAQAMHRTDTGWQVAAGHVTFLARHVILATAPHTWGFLEPTSPVAEIARWWPPTQEIDLLTVVVDTAHLRAHEQAGTLVANPDGGAKALTYASAKWEWIQRQLQARGLAGAAIVRLSYGAGIVPGDPQIRTELALCDAARLTGTGPQPWPTQALLAIAHTRLHPPAPVLSWATSQRAGPMRTAVNEAGNLGIAGAWISGSGLASVVPDAIGAGQAAAFGPVR